VRARYRFASPEIAYLLRGRVPSLKRRDLLTRLYVATRNLHPDDVAHARDLAALAPLAGFPGEAVHFHNLAITGARLRNLTLHARVLLAITTLPCADPALGVDLVDTTWHLIGARVQTLACLAG
jgi:hypothetical protein